MNYLEVTFNYNPTKVDGEILLAEVSEIPFESFVEEDGVLIGYIQEHDLDVKALKQLEILLENNIRPSVKTIKQVNWNEEWEKNFDPVIVDNQCAILADFHQLEGDFKHVIRINPKMSFGTGHHATTHLMVSEMLPMNFEHKTVLDMGTGTGVLAILAAQKGSNAVVAIDNNIWAYKNSIENVELNKVENAINVLEGEVDLIANQKFDIILANINKNVIKQQFGAYQQALNAQGILLISGVLTDDREEIAAIGQQLGMKLVKFTEKDKWSLLVFSK